MTLADQIAQAQQTLASLTRHQPVLDAAAKAVVEALGRGNKILACGNGGSAAESMHLVTELVGRFLGNRKSLPAVHLGGDASMVTCIANDFSYDEVFSRPLEALGQRGDVLVCFTTSGNPENVLRALRAATERGVASLALLGKGGGRARGKATWEVIVDSDDTARIQEAHQFLLHWLCDQIERAFPP